MNSRSGKNIKEDIDDYNRLTKLSIPEDNVEKLILSYLTANLTNIRKDPMSPGHKWLNYFGQKLTFVEPISTYFLYLLENDLLGMGLISNVAIETIAKNFPHLHAIYGFSSLLNKNLEYITHHINDFTYSKKGDVTLNYDEISNEYQIFGSTMKDINIINAYYRKLHHMLSGDNYEIFRNHSASKSMKGGSKPSLLKVNIEHIKDTEGLSKEIKDSIDRGEYSYGYIYVTDNSVKGLYLINKRDGYVEMTENFGNDNIYSMLERKFNKLGYLVVRKDIE